MKTVCKRSCYVCGHSPSSVAGRNLHYHCIPSLPAKQQIRDKWLEFLHLPPSSEWKEELWRKITLCSLHFEEDLYHREHQLQLRPRVPGAVPTRKQPAGPGVLGELFSRSHESSSSGGPLEGDAEVQPAEMDTFEEASLCTNSQVETSVNTPGTSQRGAISKFHSISRKPNLKTILGIKNRQIISPRSSRVFKICKFYRDNFQRQSRRRLVLPVSQTHGSLQEQESPDVNLGDVLLESQSQNSSVPSNSRRYSNRVKALCLAIQGCNAGAYRLLRRMLALPSSRTLIRIRESVPLSTGVSKVVLHSITKQLPTMSEIDKICVLMFDEMSLMKHLDYDRIQDHILGFEDIGGRRHPYFAHHSLVFMVRGLVSEWKQPVAFHFGQAIHSCALENAIKETVVALQGIGLKIVAIVSDMAQSNVSALQALAAKTMPERDDPTIKIGDDEIFVFADPPHLLKILRNNFIKYDIQFKGWDKQIKIARFHILREFLENERTKRFTKVYPSKLSDRHLNPNSKEKMRVKYAAQLFSFTVSNGLSLFAHITGNPLAQDLAEFISIVDNLFDSFNASSSNDPCDLRRSVSNDSKHHDLWNDLRVLLADWKFVVRTPSSKPPSSKCFELWGKNIISVQSLWRKVRDLGVMKLKTRNINQDPLESFFGSVRQHGGCNRNPTSRLFLDIFKILMLNSFSVNLVSNRSNVEKRNVALLTNLLNSEFDSRENVQSMETLSGVGHASTSFDASVSKEVEACINCLGNLSNETTGGVNGFALRLLSSFLHKHKNDSFLSSCFECFKSIHVCPHPRPSSGKATCDLCPNLNLSLACKMFQIYNCVFSDLKKNGYKPRLSEELKKVCARDLLLQELSCREHGEELNNMFLAFIIEKGIQNFCFKINSILRATARK